MTISIIIINYNTQKMTLACVQSILSSTEIPLQVIVVDNGSKFFDRAPFDALGVSVIINKTNKGFAGGVNTGLEYAFGDIVVLFNSDALPSYHMIDKFAQKMTSDKTIGIIGPHTNDPDGSHQISAGKFPTILRELVRFTPLYKWLPISTYLPQNFFTRRYFTYASDVDWVSGGCMAIRKMCREDTGTFDARYFFGVEDWDYCFRAKRKGWRVVFDPDIIITHAHSASAGGNRAYFKEQKEKIGTALFYDMYYTHAHILPRLTSLWYEIRMKRSH